MIRWILNIFKKNQPEPTPDTFYCEVRSNFAHETCKEQCEHCKKEFETFSAEGYIK